ncbi:MAG: hypothetical protein K9K32_00105 [Halanaerobiales bacterium]|nr:hypothetical protein [Halanaerobiales bacterium]
MSYAEFIDWQTEDFFENWENVSINVLVKIFKDKDDPRAEEIAEYFGIDLEDGYEELDEIINDSFFPMINFIYPLETNTLQKDAVYKTSLETNCIVLYNRVFGKNYLCLAAGGMDFSQDIGLAYAIMDKRIPLELAIDINTQKNLTVRGENWGLLEYKVIQALEAGKNRINQLLKEWS